MANKKISQMVRPASLSLTGLERVELAQHGDTVGALLAGLGSLPRGALLADRIRFESDTASTADSDPGAGQLRWNHASPASASVLYLNDLSIDSDDLTGVWSTLVPGGFIYLEKAASLSVWQKWKILSVDDASGYAKIGVALEGGAGAWSDAEHVLVTIQQPGIPPGSVEWGSLVGALSDQVDLKDALDSKEEKRNGVTAVTPSGGTATFDCALGDYFTLAPTANVSTLAFTNLPGSGRGASLMILITQDSTPRTVAWPASFKWAGGVAPSISTGSGAKDLLAVTTLDNGTTWHATLAKAFA